VILEIRATLTEIRATGRLRQKSQFSRADEENRTPAIPWRRSIKNQRMGNDHFRRQIPLHIALKTMLVDSLEVHQHGLKCNIEEDRPTGKRTEWNRTDGMDNWRGTNKIEPTVERIEREGIKLSGLWNWRGRNKIEWAPWRIGRQTIGFKNDLFRFNYTLQLVLEGDSCCLSRLSMVLIFRLIVISKYVSLLFSTVRPHKVCSGDEDLCAYESFGRDDGSEFWMWFHVTCLS
jgi:hypothetical protein